jgi:hypothetical protein
VSADLTSADKNIGGSTAEDPSPDAACTEVAVQVRGGPPATKFRDPIRDRGKRA